MECAGINGKDLSDLWFRMLFSVALIDPPAVVEVIAKQSANNHQEESAEPGRNISNDRFDAAADGWNGTEEGREHGERRTANEHAQNRNGRTVEVPYAQMLKCSLDILLCNLGLCRCGGTKALSDLQREKAQYCVKHVK